MWQTKSRNHFKNGDQILIQICPGDQTSWKLRLFCIETQHRDYDKINKGGQKFNFGLQKLTIP